MTSKIRTRIMKAVRASGNKSTEMALIQVFRKEKLAGWRRKSRLFGKPDFIFQKFRLAVFVDGCFWHGHDCRNTRPATNKSYWEEKRNKNRKRDSLVNRSLKKIGWQVIRIWECELKAASCIGKRMSDIRRALNRLPQ